MKRTFINKVILKGCCSGSRCINKAEVLSRNTSGRQSGFTLVELLVVVLIIGILSAVAIPMYQGAVDKSHWSIMLPASKAIKDAEEAFKMTNGKYSDTMEHLDVQISNDDLTFTLNTPNNLADPNVIRVTNSKLDNVRLASYLDDSPLFAGQLHCEANDGENGRGTRLCSKLLQGQELNTVDGYTRYLLNQDIDKVTCGNADQTWSNRQTKCYKTEEARCKDLYGNSMWNGEFCGYTNKTGAYTEGMMCDGEGAQSCRGSSFTEGAVCKGESSGEKDIPCYSVTVKNGGVCEGINGGYGDWYKSSCVATSIQEGGICKGKAPAACQQSTIYAGGLCIGEADGSCGAVTISGGICQGDGTNSCREAIIEDGGVCEGNAQGSCSFLHTVKEGGKCIANAPNTCQLADGWYGGYWNSAYEGTGATSGCCEGTYCPSSAPRCECSNHEKMNASGKCI